MSSSSYSPGVFLSPPTLASTPSTVPLYRFYASQPLDLFSPPGSRHNKSKDDFPLTEFPLLILDKVFLLLSDQDLRAFHQVSHSWKSLLELRVGDNNRRLELVRKIRDNKENIRNGSMELPTLDLNRVNRERTSDRKSVDSLVLIECTNLINTSDASSTNDNATGNPLLTPTSRFAFQSFEEAEKSLKRGQKLFRCRRCSGPVPSPILAAGDAKEESDVTKSRMEATRCRLTSRMGNLTPDESRRSRGRKKSRTFTDMPPPLSPIDIPTTISLGERMSKSLIISAGTTWSPGAFKKVDMFNSNILEESKEESSCSSVGIDLHLNRSDVSSIDVKLNFTNSFDTSFSPFRSQSQQWKESQNSISDSCLSDPGLTFNCSESSTQGKSSLFPNLIPSPKPVMVLANLCRDALRNSEILKDLMKPSTLNTSSEGSVLKISNLDNILDEHDKNDIHSSTYESHSKSIYDINGNHDKSLIICGDKERQQCTSFGDVSRSLVPSLSLRGTDQSSRSTSDYFSSAGSILRDGSLSYCPEISTGRFGTNLKSDRSLNLNDSVISKNQSLGIMMEFNEDKEDPPNVSSESINSSASCPNLNESFVLECPNPSCSFRFCSSCNMGEHLGKPCRIIDSESFESLNESNENKYFHSSTRNNKSKSKESMGKGKGTGSNNNKIKNPKKSLRRLLL